MWSALLLALCAHALDPITVPSFRYLTRNYASLLANASASTVFYIAENDTYLAPGLVESLLDLVPRRWTKRLRLWLWFCPSSVAPLQWIEFAALDPDIRPYPGYLPASSCQSQQFGDTGLVLFAFSYSNKVSITSTWRHLLMLLPHVIAFTVGQRFGMQVERINTVLGTIVCKLLPGQTGQVLIKPTFAAVDVVARRATWQSKKLLLHPEFERYDRMHVLLEYDTIEVGCATDDVVPLFCHGHELGVVNWDDPLGVGYDSIQRVKEDNA